MLPDSIFTIQTQDQFKNLALASFNYQWEHNTVYRRFCNYLKVDPATITELDQIPFLPIQFFKEFKEFAIKGNMIDIAVGVIIGAAFNKVIDTLVKKIIMPPISLLTDDFNFESKKLVLREAVLENEKVIKEEVFIGYGELITVLINFFIIAWCVFLVVKISNRLRIKAEDTKNKKVTTPKDIELLADLKEIMQEQNELLRKRN